MSEGNKFDVNFGGAVALIVVLALAFVAGHYFWPWHGIVIK